MILVREYLPNGMPFLIQGEITDPDIRTVRIYPISHDGTVLPELPEGYFNDDFITVAAIRLTKIYTEENN